MTLQELKQKRYEAAQAVEAEEKRLQDLETKHTQLREKLSSLKATTVRAEADKKKALEAFVKGEIGQAELDQVKEAYERAKKAENEAAEMLEAVERAKKEVENNRPKLREELNKAERELWSFMLEELKTELRAVAGEKVERALALAGKIFGGIDYPVFLASIFKLPMRERVADLQKELEEEYLR